MGAGGSVDLELERLKGELGQGQAPKEIGGAGGQANGQTQAPDEQPEGDEGA
jgi:hypothetical protein